MTTDSNKLPAPPYVAFRTLTTFLDWLGEVGVPNRLDRTFWGRKLSGAYGTQTIAALRFFKLVNGNNIADPTLEEMAGNEGQRKALLKKLILEHYAPALEGLALERATPGELNERFKRYGIQGNTFRRAVTFFIHACQYCSIPLSPHITQMKRVPSSEVNANRPRPRGRPPKVRKPEPVPAPMEASRIEQLGLHPAVEALLRDLNRAAATWKTAERDRWIETFTKMLDYAYPAVGEGKQGRE